jgi:hypothetical protein
VVIAGGRVERIEAVTLDRETLASGNFISDLDADLVADSLPAPDDDAGGPRRRSLRRRPEPTGDDYPRRAAVLLGHPTTPTTAAAPAAPIRSEATSAGLSVAHDRN